jgi:6-phosphogluconolactonase/Glucosamine-6-phosphate isomerase/deaminase
MDAKFYRTEGSELTSGKIKVKLLGDSGEVFYEMALLMADTIEKNNSEGKKTVFILPVGPIGQYPIFVRLANERKLNLSECVFINMDEYLTDDGAWIAKDDPLSFRGFMERNLYSLIPAERNVKEENRVFPDPEHPEHILEVIKKYGKVDIAFGGIGINGHVAFNEAEPVSAAEFATRSTRALYISAETRTANGIGDKGGAIDQMPKMAVTIGMKEILMAEKIVLGVFRDWHRAVLRRAIFDAPSGEFPVTLLQNHKDATILSNANAARRPF